MRTKQAVNFTWIALVAALLAHLFAQPARAQPAPLPDEVRTQVQAILEDAEVPGASIVLIEEGQVSRVSHFGVRDKATGEPVTSNTVFRAGSISKSFTSIAIMQLVERGKLDLNTPASQLLPELVIDNPWSETHPVRVVHLLEHTAGFNDIAFRHYLIEGSDLTVADAVRLYAPYRSRWQPGSRTSYSNAGPVIAGRIVEVVSGQGFEEYVATNIIGPLGMNSAQWTKTLSVERSLAKSYFWDGSKEEPFIEIAGRPSGSLNTTAIDLAGLPMLMLARGSVNERTIITPQSALRIERPASSDAAKAGLVLGYSLGNDPNLNGKTTFFGHDGSIDGFAATARYSPDLNAGYVVMINMTSGALDDVAKVLRDYLELGADAPSIKSVPLPEELKASLNGQFQTSTPRRSFLAPLIGLSQWQGVSLKDDTLRFKGLDWQHVGQGVFHAVGESAPGLVAIYDDQGFRLQSGTVTYRRVSPLEMWTKLGLMALTGLAAVIGALYAIFWLVGLVRGTLSETGGVAPRAWPTFALAMALGAGIAPLMLFGTGSFDLLGKPTPVGWLVYGITLLAPFFVAIAAAVFFRSKTSLTARWLGSFQLLVAVIVCVYLIHGDWFALRIWNA